MELASVHSQEENDYLVSQTTDSDFWIGFRDNTNEGDYYWNDGTCVDFLAWADGEPNNMGDEDCTVMYRSGFWNDSGCNNSQ